MVGLATSAS